MTSDCNVRPFPFAGTLLHIAPEGGASVLQPPWPKAELGGLDGRLLAAFPLSTPADAHSDVWEMHPTADEVLFMLSGELQVDYSDGRRMGTAKLKAGEALVMPRGVWHRLVLREAGLLLALTPPRATQSRPDGGGRP